VVVTGGTSCHPFPTRPCEVLFTAEAHDPEGDHLTFRWEGCATGSEVQAVCRVTRPGIHTASLRVSDGNGNVVHATGDARGTNRAPLVELGAGPPNPAPSGTQFNFAGGQPTDPDGDDEPNLLCTRATVTVTGPCVGGLAGCGGVGDVFDWDVRTLQGPGTCVVEARVTDFWGATGVDRVTFQVLP
jgi:hypothetical protein